MDIRFYVDPLTGLPHLLSHGVEEIEAVEALADPLEDRAGREGSRIALGRTMAGRYLRIIYVPDDSSDGVFVITAYELRGRPLAALRRRRRRKQ